MKQDVCFINQTDLVASYDFSYICSLQMQGEAAISLIIAGRVDDDYSFRPGCCFSWHDDIPTR